MEISTQFEHPYVLLLISPLVLAGLYYIRRGVSKWIIISRIIILSLLIMALASPFSLGINTVRDDAPKITVISDDTKSMDLFNKDLGKKVFDALQPKTPTKFREFAGIKSPIGDEVIGASENNNLVLLTDGNANYGKDLFDAISLVSQTGTRVFAVEQKPLHNDASVEIVSSKNIIIGNENVFNVVVRQAGDDLRYKLDVEIDGKSVYSDSITQKEREKSIPITGSFTTLGSHKLKAMITPATEDGFPLNNVFYRSVFVVPKPKVLAVTSDTISPLFTSLIRLYDIINMNSVPDDISNYKAVIIDNKGAAELPADTLRNYVGNGGGIVVVGGDSSYDKGLYNNSPVEKIMPIISRAGEYKGGKNIILILDVSESTMGNANEEIKRNALKIIEDLYKKSKDSYVGVVAFGGTKEKIDLKSISSDSNKQSMVTFINSLEPSTGNTNMQDGLLLARDMFKDISGTKQVIAISDGGIFISGEAEYQNIVNAAKDLKSNGIFMIFINVAFDTFTQDGFIHYEGKAAKAVKFIKDEKRDVSYMELLSRVVNSEYYSYPTGSNADINFDESGVEPTPTQTPEEKTKEYAIMVVDSDHFITKGINVSTASITGYNEVIYKLGSDNLVATAPGGKPIIITWGFGLGRVASFATDNGGGDTMWASEVYSGESSRLISSMINWAIGDPRPKEGDVINAEDIWAGTPGRVIVTTESLNPQVKLDGTSLELSRTGPTTYETSINLDNPDTENFHDISGYGIAVNYPLEYREIGFNEKFKSVIESNGGRVYKEDEVEGLLFLDIKEKAVRTVNEPKSEKEPYLLAALVLFLTEVIIRRIKDYRKERPVIEENEPRTAQMAE